MENTVYKAPESSLLNNTEKGSITQMKRFSAWGVFGLTLITVGIYPIYWLYNRAESINLFHSNKISKNLLNSFLLFVVLSFAIEIFLNIYPNNDLVNILSVIVSIIYLILYLVVLFAIRNRLKAIIGTAISPVLTFLFNAIYLQYRINKAIDQEKQK